MNFTSLKYYLHSYQYFYKSQSTKKMHIHPGPQSLQPDILLPVPTLTVLACHSEQFEVEC